MTEKNYPGVLARVKALMIDYIILLIVMVIASLIFSQIENVADSARIIVFVVFFLLYDPILTSSIGGTIGHQTIGLRVRKADDESANINFFFALIRYILKTFLGWLSLLTVMGNDRRKAIHDFAAQSVVVYK